MKHRIYGNELKYLQEVIDTGFRSSKGSIMTQRLEKDFAVKMDRKIAISFINGTATMHAALEAAGIGQGDEVIVPSLTMSSTAMAVLQAGATPVFADIKKDTFLIDPLSINQKISNKTKAIITVSLYGLCPEMNYITKIAKANRLLLIEDNAQCISGKFKGKLAGSFGDVASYSFQSSKHMTSGEGGMITTDDAELADAIRKVSSLGYAGVGAHNGKITKKDIQNPNYSRHIMLGWNYRMPELCAAVALAQLENLDDLVKRRIEVAKRYLDVVSGCSWLRPQYVGDEYECDYWAFVVYLDRADISWEDFRNKFCELGGDGIYAAWKLTYEEPMFKLKSFLGRERGLTREEQYTGICPVAEIVQPKLLQFKTNYWDLTIADKQMNILRKTIKYFSK